MKYRVTLPLSALIMIAIMALLIQLNLIPEGEQILAQLRESDSLNLFVLLALVILLEAIVYVGFYFPGQFFAVVVVVLYQPSLTNIAGLTVVMVCAATLASLINYVLGRQLKGSAKDSQVNGFSPSVRQLLAAMIHINALAFFMFNLGAKGGSIRWVWLSGLLNLPYYLVLVVCTSLLSEQVLTLAENSLIVVSLTSVWLLVALYLDWQSGKFKHLIKQPN